MSKNKHQENEESSILWARLAVRHTKKTCFIALLVPIIASGILYAGGLFELTDPSANEYNVKDDIITERTDARARAREEYPLEVDDDVVPLTKRNRVREISILFRNTDGGKAGSYSGAKYDENAQRDNLITPEGLAFLKSAEDTITNDKDYTRFCWNDRSDNQDCEGNTLECKLPFSITNHPQLYGVYNNGRFCGRKPGSEKISSSAFQAFMNSLVINGTVNPQYSVFFANDFNGTAKVTQAIRSYIYFGAPIANTTEETTDKEKNQAFNDWSRDLEKKVEEEGNTEKYNIFLSSIDRDNSSFGPIIFQDLAYSGISIILVFIVVWIHTTSGFLACATLAQILLSFPLTYLLYRHTNTRNRGVLQITYFAALQIMMIFLLLGIGADDAFVFTDSFKQAPVELGQDVSLEARMSWSYKRAVKAMTVTSFTTAVAFFSTAFSPIMPISTLGIWAGFLVLFQFLLVITVFPSALILWQRFWRVRKWYRCFKPAPETPLEAESAAPTTVFGRLKARFFKGGAEDELRPIERFFNGPWTRITKMLRYGLVVAGIILMGLSIWLSTRLEAPTEQEKFLPDDHPIQEAADTLSDEFPSFNSNDNTIVTAIWGILGIDREGTNRYDPEDLGDPIFDDKFNIRSIAAQQHIFESCEFFASTELDLLVNSTTIPEDEKVECWPQDYLKWRALARSPGFKEFANDREQIAELVEFSEFTTPEGEKPYLKYLSGQHIGFNKNRTRILWTETRFLSDLVNGAPYSITWPNQEEWHEALENFNEEKSPVDEVSRPYVSGGIMWSFAVTQKALVENMYRGILIVLAVSLVALAVSTGNLIVSVLALACIAGILTNVLAILYLIGWKLGITESIGVVISIGFSFDYIAHVANAYVESDRSLDKTERTRLALTELGISVLAGAISTLLAGAMLFFTTIIFFVKFGVFIVVTVTLALIWGLLFFPGLLHIFGPTGNTAEIWTFAKRVLPCFGKRNDQKESTEEDAENAVTE